MSWRISPKIADILDKGGGCAGISRYEALSLMRLDRNCLSHTNRGPGDQILSEI